MATNQLHRTQTIEGIDAHTLTIGPVTTDEDGRAHWTVTLVGVDTYAEEPTYRDITVTIRLRSDANRQGLWTDTGDAYRDQQILGSSQFDASSRRHVVAGMIRHYGIEQEA